MDYHFELFCQFLKDKCNIDIAKIPNVYHLYSECLELIREYARYKSFRAEKDLMDLICIYFVCHPWDDGYDQLGLYQYDDNNQYGNNNLP